MNRIIYLLAAIALVSNSFAQKIKFDSQTFDFGTFNEEKGPQTHVFKFTNTGSKSLILTEVKASCGCTTPEYTKQPIAPNKTGIIKVTFDPKNRPGPFDKSVTVKSNAENSVVVLKISGVVEQRKKTITDLYPQQIGGLNQQVLIFPV